MLNKDFSFYNKPFCGIHLSTKCFCVVVVVVTSVSLCLCSLLQCLAEPSYVRSCWVIVELVLGSPSCAATQVQC